MAEVDSGLEQLLHRDDGHTILLPTVESIRHRAPKDDRGHARTYFERDPVGPHCHGSWSAAQLHDQPLCRASGQLNSSRSRCLQMEHGLGVDLAGAALGHPEDVADLGKVQTFVVVQA